MPLRFLLLPLTLCFLGSDLRADPAADYRAGIAAEKAGRYEEALQSYQSAVKSLDGWAVLHRQIGNCLVRLGRPADAIQAYGRYLNDKPDDQAVKNYRDKLQASLGPPQAAPDSLPDSLPDSAPASKPSKEPSSAGGMDGVTTFMKDNPHDYRRLRIGFEIFTPLVAGVDLGWRVDKHHEVGLGFVNLAAGSQAGMILHPRWRYHNARFLWDSFYEIGATYATFKDRHYAGRAMGLNLGLGVERVSAWPFNWFWMVSLGFINASLESGVSSSLPGGSVTVPYLIPWGLSWGLLF